VRNIHGSCTILPRSATALGPPACHRAKVGLGYLAGQIVTIAKSHFDDSVPVIELDDKRIPLLVVDPLLNGSRQRPLRREPPARTGRRVDFDTSKTLEADITSKTLAADTEDQEDDDDAIF
jgi:hypothetical protein